VDGVTWRSNGRGRGWKGEMEKGLEESKETPREHPPSSRRRAQKARTLCEAKPKDAAPKVVLSAIVSATRHPEVLEVTYRAISVTRVV
jgi:transposase